MPWWGGFVLVRFPCPGRVRLLGAAVLSFHPKTFSTMTRVRIGILSLMLMLLGCLVVHPAEAVELEGDWSLQLESGTPAWMSVRQEDGKYSVRLRLHGNVAWPNHLGGLELNSLHTDLFDRIGISGLVLGRNIQTIREKIDLLVISRRCNFQHVQ